MRGFTLTELIVTIGIVSILLALGGLAYNNWTTIYQIEAQVRKMQSDLTQARLNAMERKRQYYVIMSANKYQIAVDMNYSESLDSSPTDSYQAAVPIAYPVSWTGTLVMNTSGIVSSTTTSAMPISIPIVSSKTNLNYNCLQIYPTRISSGLMQGDDCVAK